jgi:hypothetical protein
MDFETAAEAPRLRDLRSNIQDASPAVFTLGLNSASLTFWLFLAPWRLGG